MFSLLAAPVEYDFESADVGIGRGVSCADMELKTSVEQHRAKAEGVQLVAPVNYARGPGYFQGRFQRKASRSLFQGSSHKGVSHGYFSIERSFH